MICRHRNPPLFFLLDDAAAQDAFACFGVVKYQGLAGRDGTLGVVEFDPQAVAVGIDRAGRFTGSIAYLAQGPERCGQRLFDPSRFTGVDSLGEQILFRADDADTAYPSKLIASARSAAPTADAVSAVNQETYPADCQNDFAVPSMSCFTCFPCSVHAVQIAYGSICKVRRFLTKTT